MTKLRAIVLCAVLAGGCNFGTKPTFPAIDDPNMRGSTDAAAFVDSGAVTPPVQDVPVAFDSPPPPPFDAAASSDAAVAAPDASADAGAREDAHDAPDVNSDAPDGDVPDVSPADVTPTGDNPTTDR